MKNTKYYMRARKHDFKKKMLCLKPDFTIVIFIHYKPHIAVAVLDF